MQTIDPPVDLRSWTDPNDGALQTLTTNPLHANQAFLTEKSLRKA